MPAAIAGAVAVGLAGALTGVAISTIIINVAISLALGVVSQLLTPKPKSPTNRDELGSKLLIRSTISPHQVVYGRARLSGTLIFAESTGVKDKFLHLVIAYAGHEIDGFEKLHINDTIIDIATETNVGGFVLASKFGPDKIRAFFYNGSQLIADSNLIAETSNKWTEAHIGQGITYIYYRLEFDRDVFIGGVPQLRVVVRGKKVWDPRLHPGNPAFKFFSENAALCQLDYIMSEQGFNVPLSEINEASWVAAANVCDETVDEMARYTINGSFFVNNSPIDNLEDLLTASLGSIIYQQGAFYGYAGSATVSTDTITESDLTGPVEVTPRPTRDALYNAIKGIYLDETNFYAPTDFPKISVALYKTEDNEEELIQDIELPFTINTRRAQRIARLSLDAHRQGIRATFPLKLSKLGIAAWDTVTVTLTDFGWSSKKFRILSWAFNEAGIVVIAQEEADTIYTFDPDTILEFDPAPDTNLPDPGTVSQPGAPEITESLFTARQGGGVKAKVEITWIASNDAFLDHYVAEYKLSSTTDWLPLATCLGLCASIEDIVPGKYDFRVKAVNTIGVSSLWSEALNRSVQGLGATPADITNFTITAIGGMALLRWDRHPDLDVRMGGFIRFRHSKAPTGASWSSSVSIGNPITGDQTVNVLPLKLGTYFARAFDSSNIQSASPASASTNGAQVLNFGSLSTISEHPGWSGTKTDTVVTASKLKLDSEGLFDDIVSLDAVSNLDNSAGIKSSGTYDFSANLDLTTVTRVRLQTVIDAVIVNINDFLDSRDLEMDDWVDFAGVDIDSADAQIWVRETDDDPASSAASFSEYQRLESGEFEARGFEFQLRLTSSDPIFNIEVSEATINKEELV